MSLIKCLSIYRISFVFTFLLLSIDSIAMKPALRCNDFLGDSPRLALTEDPFLSSERIEMEIRRVTEEISLRFGADLETNLHLESLLGKVTGENLALYGLQVRLLENRIVPKTEFVGRLFRLQKIREELDRLGSSLGVFTTDFAETPQGGKQIQRQISVSRKAQKDIDALQPLYQKKYYQFVSEIGLVRSLQDLSSKWSLEKVDMFEIQNGRGLYTVRLNHGYRVLFRFDSAQGVSVIRISKTVTHNN